MAGLLVGVDIGGTKTHIASLPCGHAADAVVTAPHEIVLPSTWRPGLGDIRADAAGITQLLTSQFGREASYSALVVGAHGYDNSDQCHALERELGAAMDCSILVVNDSELMAPAMGLPRAIGLVVGTGAIATARDDNGMLLSAGGWGWLLGDEGSAPALVRDAARAVLTRLDEGGDVDQLGARLMAAFGARNGPELALAVTDTASLERWGSHAREVFEAADEGSGIADVLIREAGAQLAQLVFRLLGRGIAADTVVAGGAVIQQQPRLREAVRFALAGHEPTIVLQTLDRPPVIGALALARDLVAPR
jgi:glucosamine kinase